VSPDIHAIVGVWEVVADGAPFRHHVMTFHADGTMLQSNPDHGNRITSDSNGMGVWRAEGSSVTGAFLEFTVDRDDPELVTKGTVHFELFVSGTSFSGMATANFHDLDGGLLAGPLKAEMTGVRFTL
jgi:hypothetical protein